MGTRVKLWLFRNDCAKLLSTSPNTHGALRFPQRCDKWIKSAVQQQKQRYHHRAPVTSCSLSNFLFPHHFSKLCYILWAVFTSLSTLQRSNNAADLSPLWVCWQDFLMLPHYCCMGQIGPRDSWVWRGWCWTSQTPRFCSVVNWSLTLNQTVPYPLRAAANTTGCAGGLPPQLPCLHHEACGHDGGAARGGDALLDGEGLA